jgi:hypothetical protein
LVAEIAWDAADVMVDAAVAVVGSVWVEVVAEHAVAVAVSVDHVVVAAVTAVVDDDEVN